MSLINQPNYFLKISVYRLNASKLLIDKDFIKFVT